MLQQRTLDPLPVRKTHRNATSKPMRSSRAFWAIVITAVVVIGLIISWYAGVRNQFYPDNFGVVEPGKIYRSAQISRRVLRKTLLDNHIQVIVDLSQEDTPNARAEKQIAAELGVQRIAIPGLGGKGIGDPAAYPKAIKAIVEAGRENKAVLVHCQSGSQRTSGVIAVYRMLIQGKLESEAFSEAKKFHYRPTQNPHLLPFVEQHLPEWKAQLQAEHFAP